jgi:sulfonate transport system substrate-binding protein
VPRPDWLHRRGACRCPNDCSRCCCTTSQDDLWSRALQRSADAASRLLRRLATLSIPFYIADKEGFFKELNIDVEYETFTNGPAMMEANASWDVAGAGLGGLLNGMLGRSIKVIGISDYEKNLARCLHERPPPWRRTQRTPRAGRAQRGSIPIGTTAQATLVAALEQVNLGLKDVESVNMDVASALTAYNGGQGDGLARLERGRVQRRGQGLHPVGRRRHVSDFVGPCATLATPGALKNKRDLVVASLALFHLHRRTGWRQDAGQLREVGRALLRKHERRRHDH